MAEVVRKLTSQHVLVASPFLLAELRRVLGCILDYSGCTVSISIRSIARWRPSRLWRLLLCPKNKILCESCPMIRTMHSDLAAAVAGEANILCTRNKHFFHPAVIAYCNQRIN